MGLDINHRLHTLADLLVHSSPTNLERLWQVQIQAPLFGG